MINENITNLYHRTIQYCQSIQYRQVVLSVHSDQYILVLVVHVTQYFLCNLYPQYPQIVLVVQCRQCRQVDRGQLQQ